MAWVTDELIEVWNSGEYVGENTPQAVVQVQRGKWVRGWYTDAEVSYPPVKALIYGEGGYGGPDAQPGHWSPKWVAAGDWIDLPNLSSIKRTKDLSAKGVTVLEVVLDAQDFVDKTGALGDAYHVIAPGWLASTRSFVGRSRPDPRWDTSEWSPVGEQGVITDGVKIRVWQGYGEPETASGNCPPVDGGTNGAWTFAGQIDDVDIDGNPNTITITARTGKLLTDQRVFRASKSVQLKDPITFYDSLAATAVSMVGSGASASSETQPARNVLDFPNNSWDPNGPAYKTVWESAGNIDDSNLEWIEIRLPQGRYDEFWLACPAGLMAFVGIYAREVKHWVRDPTSPDRLILETESPTMDGEPITEGWVDFGHNAPGANGGWPYLKEFKTGTTLPDKFPGLDRPRLGHSFELGKHSILRVGLTKPSGAAEHAKVGDLHGLRRHVQKEIKRQQFILVDDASEVVKVALRWAGYRAWEVEEAGVRLSDGTNYGPGVVAKTAGRLAFNRAKYLVDIVEDLAGQLGYIFFIADPVDGNSDGIPTFRRDSSLLKDSNYVAASLDENTMLTGLKVKETDEDRPSIIRVRGKTASVRKGGVPLGGDSVKRIMAVYHPPWGDDTRSAGVLRHIVYQDDQLITYAMCLYGCFLIAIGAALQMHTAIAEIPAHPILELDDQVSVLDEPTGTNSRLWIVKTEDTMVLGANASWKQTVEGSLLDTQDLQEVIDQVTGRTSYVIGTPNPPTFTQTNPPVDWSRITDPDTGRTSGYTSPVSALTKGRTLVRTR